MANWQSDSKNLESGAGCIKPAKIKAAMLLSHGAGGNCKNPLMVAVADAFCEAGYCVLRWDLPFRQAAPSRRSGGFGRARP